MLHIILKIYKRIPVSFLNLLAFFFYLIPKKYRYGKIFHNQYEYLKKSEIKSEEDRKKKENFLFVRTVKNAYENVPYYRRIFDDNGINVDNIRSIEDIHIIPFIDKKIIQDNKQKMISNKCNIKRMKYVTTSGSTGEPLGFYQDKDIMMREWAYTNYIWSRVGYKPDSSRLVLRGKVFHEQLRGKNWQWDALKRELSCNIFNMTEITMEEYCIAIEKYKPEFIHGYMSAIMILAKYVEHRQLKHKFKAVLATSESILVYQREFVEKIFGTRVFSFYGHSERLVMAAECEESNEYHIEPEYGYAEIIDASGNVIMEPGVEGELVATGFMNTGMPLIRYRTGDIAAWSECNKVCKCGRPHLRIKYIAGRKQDILVNKQGALISLTAINFHSKVFEHIRKYQFCQEKIGETVLKIVTSESFEKSELLEIDKQLMEKMGNQFDIKIQIVSDIPVGKNGKYKLVEQKMNIQI